MNSNLLPKDSYLRILGLPISASQDDTQSRCEELLCATEFDDEEIVEKLQAALVFKQIVSDNDDSGPDNRLSFDEQPTSVPPTTDTTSATTSTPRYETIQLTKASEAYPFTAQEEKEWAALIPGTAEQHQQTISQGESASLKKGKAAKAPRKKQQGKS
ncbi:MAG: hypothetical protein Q9166_006851 [cf. Caloplaca sp. 2 TL-2023]